MAAPAQPNNMDEILSSIRSTLEEETTRGAAGQAGGSAADVLMLDEELSDDEILALTETDLAGETEAGGGAMANSGLIDLAAFTASGSVTEAATAPVVDDVLGANLPAETIAAAAPSEPLTPTPAVTPVQPMVAAEPAASVEELDRLMAEIKHDQTVPHAEKVANLLGDTPVPANLNAESTPRLELPALPGANGLQVALPAAVLAEALRPLITGWLNDNLPAVVERLVQQEIAKLASQ